MATDRSIGRALLREVLFPAPTPTLAPERRRRASLVITLAALGGPVVGALVAVVKLLHPELSVAPASIAAGGFLIAWLLARQGRDLWATWFLCIACFCAPLAGIAINPQHDVEFQQYSLYMPAFIAAGLLNAFAAGAFVVAAEITLACAASLGGVDVVSAALFGFAAGPVSVVMSLLVELDLQQLRAQAADLAAARDEAVAASQAKSRFLARAGHELRTPLTSAMGYTDLVIEHLRLRDDDSLVGDMERVRRSCELLRTLVDEILTLSRIDLGRLPIQTERVDCAMLARDCAELLTLQAHANNDTLRVDAGSELLVVSDGKKLTQILLNLLSNAVRATRDGSVTVKVLVDSERTGGVVLEVVDTGIGLTDDEKSHLFDEFWQGAHHPAAASGTGLGLAITKQLCRLLGAEITVCSTPGKGSTFTVRVPPELPAQNSSAPMS